jgi:transposase
MVRKSYTREEIANWRYEQIKEAAAEDVGPHERKQILRRLREKSIQRPSGRSKPISHGTFYRWLKLYREGGLAALQPKRRQDKGKARVLPDETVDAALTLQKSDPGLSLKAVAAAMESTFPDLSVRVSPKTLHTRLKARPDYLQVQSARRQFLRSPGAAKWRAQPLLPEERAILEKWRKSNDKKRWQISVVLLESADHHLTLQELMQRSDRPSKTIFRWLANFHKFRLNYLNEIGRRRPNRKTSETSVTVTKRILELLHEPPPSFGLNRSNWSTRSLAEIYKKQFGADISSRTVSRYVRKVGYRWKKARRVLTSPDLEYREKVQILLDALRSLEPTELLFFIDELGPLRVKKYGGRCYVKHGERATYAQQQAHKGSITLSGALSATTNQMTWCYGDSKDTSAMIDLIELLFNEHHDMRRLYITWDAAFWHDSNALIAWLDTFNAQTREERAGPIIELVPLPRCSQFLNVIESVFSGMKRAVIHHSDYDGETAMTSAISAHFKDRNDFFKQNPRRAGKKIWDIDFFEHHDNLRSGNYREW